jgi:hypothetical protein
LALVLSAKVIKKGTGKNDLNTEKCQDRKMPKYSLPIVRAIALGSQVKL